MPTFKPAAGGTGATSLGREQDRGASKSASGAPSMAPLSRLSRSAARRVRAIFTDVDGTLTTGGKLLDSTYRALWDWKAAGGSLALVTGRPAGWAEALARMFPVDAVIAENGGVTFAAGDGGGLERLYAVPESRLASDRSRALRAARAVERAVPGARLSMDSRYTEVDLAIDYNESARLGPEAASRIEAFLRRRGFNAVRSSVHVNFWSGSFDKLIACRALAASMGLPESAVAYCGDSLNDEPMFEAFELSVGVANVRDVLDRLAHPPRFATRAREGRGFEELVRHLLKARGRPRRPRR